MSFVGYLLNDIRHQRYKITLETPSETSRQECADAAYIKCRAITDIRTNEEYVNKQNIQTTAPFLFGEHVNEESRIFTLLHVLQCLMDASGLRILKYWFLRGFGHWQMITSVRDKDRKTFRLAIIG